MFKIEYTFRNLVVYIRITKIIPSNIFLLKFNNRNAKKDVKYVKS